LQRLDQALIVSGYFVTLTEKSWMPAFAGMTGKGAGGGSPAFIRDLNRIA
jgi:hypothetical protein